MESVGRGGENLSSGSEWPPDFYPTAYRKAWIIKWTEERESWRNDRGEQSAMTTQAMLGTQQPCSLITSSVPVSNGEG